MGSRGARRRRDRRHDRLVGRSTLLEPAVPERPDPTVGPSGGKRRLLRDPRPGGRHITVLPRQDGRRPAPGLAHERRAPLSRRNGVRAARQCHCLARGHGGRFRSDAGQRTSPAPRGRPGEGGGHGRVRPSRHCPDRGEYQSCRHRGRRHRRMHRSFVGVAHRPGRPGDGVGNRRRKVSAPHRASR